MATNNLIKVGDYVEAPMKYGYAPVHGYVTDMWTNSYGVLMAIVDFGGKTMCPVKRLKKM